MTTSTPRTDRSGRRADGGFTLVEVMVSATLTTFILAGVLSAFLLIGRTGFAASGYSEVEAETRRALEIFGADARRASGIQWNSAQSITLSLVTATNAMTLVTYAYDGDTSSPTYRCFYRLAGDASSTVPRRVLVHQVADNFTFRRYKLDTSGSTDGAASTDPETKEIEVALTASRSGVTAGAASQTALSARYILRNKRITN